jgi:hypothetical protein
MTTATSGGHPALVRPFDAASGRAVPASWLARIPLRSIVARAALLLGLLAFLVAAMAARFAFYAGGAFAPPEAMPIAVAASIVAVLAFIASALAQDRG